MTILDRRNSFMFTFSANRWRSMSKILCMSRALSNDQLTKVMDDLKINVPATEAPTTVNNTQYAVIDSKLLSHFNIFFRIIDNSYQ